VVIGLTNLVADVGFVDVVVVAVVAAVVEF
jgi:hypothetical protein